MKSQKIGFAIVAKLRILSYLNKNNNKDYSIKNEKKGKTRKT